MSIIRVEKKENYTVISNKPLNDERLSWEARGVLAYLLSKPNNWRVRAADLVRRGPAGEAKVRRILCELETLGYIERRRLPGKGGRFEWESVVREEPTIPQFSTNGKPTCGKSSRGKAQDIVNTDLTNTEGTNTENSKEPAANAAGRKRRARKTTPKPKAIVVYREVTHLYPPKGIWDDIASVVTDVGRWRRVVKAWVALGWNPRNIAGMLDYYRRGEIPSTAPRRDAPAAPRAAVEEVH